jgi:predicted transcriptional regulator
MLTMAAVLLEDNRALLLLIRGQRPKLLTELPALSRPRVPKLSRSQLIMEGYGLVKLKRNEHSGEPMVLATNFKILVD